MKYTPPVKGKTAKKLSKPDPTGWDFANTLQQVSTIVKELKDLKQDVITTVQENIDNLNKTTTDFVENLTEEAQNLEEMKTEAFDAIEEKAVQGEKGEDADEDKIVETVLSKIPKVDTNALTKAILAQVPKLDKRALVKEILTALPKNKASLKIIQEKIEVDPMSVIDKILELAKEGKFKLKSENIDGLDQTISAFYNQVGRRGYLHGGGDTVVAGTNVTITSNPNGTKTISATGGSSVTPSPLSKVDDTNVTLTLGGTPLTALLQSVSLTLGWTGTLAVSRGGSGAGTLTGILVGNGTSPFTTVTAPSGTIVGTTDTQTLTNKRITKRVLALSAGSATPVINTDSYDVVHITAQSAAITSFTTNLTGTPVDGDTLRISITDNGTARAITWGASFEASGFQALPTTTVINVRLDIGFFWNSETSKWRCIAAA